MNQRIHRINYGKRQKQGGVQRTLRYKIIYHVELQWGNINEIAIVSLVFHGVAADFICSHLIFLWL